MPIFVPGSGALGLEANINYVTVVNDCAYNIGTNISSTDKVVLVF